MTFLTDDVTTNQTVSWE